MVCEKKFEMGKVNRCRWWRTPSDVSISHEQLKKNCELKHILMVEQTTNDFMFSQGKTMTEILLNKGIIIISAF
jgi:hypothetical protein